MSDQAPPPPPPPPPPGDVPPPPPPPPGYGAPQPASVGGYELAEWPQRALAFLIDAIAPTIAIYLVFAIIGAALDSGAIIMLGWLAAIGWIVYNYGYVGGTTGQSMGKKIAGIKLVNVNTGQPVGAGMGIARYFVHIIDSIPCYLGFLWPLWDAQKRTFTDMILTDQRVVVAPKA
ncbi:MAG TPA: RDD family protein [Nocardioidaceae bacterium]|nr:RDD family protein [Nocardioidaceae bacterium]